MLALMNTHMLKNQKSSGTEFQRYGDTTVTAKELTSRQKEKPHGKKNNLTAERMTTTSWQKK